MRSDSDSAINARAKQYVITWQLLLTKVELERREALRQEQGSVIQSMFWLICFCFKNLDFTLWDFNLDFDMLPAKQALTAFDTKTLNKQLANIDRYWTPIQKPPILSCFFSESETSRARIR